MRPESARRTWRAAAYAATLCFSASASTAWAQLNLPPPPPPPLDKPADLPPTDSASPVFQPRAPAISGPRYANPAGPSRPRRYRALRRRHVAVVVYIEEAAPRFLALTVNPLALLLGRLSGAVEVMVAPQHSLIVSPNILALQEGRGDRNNLISEGLGFATRTSGSLGVEIGYHYWLAPRPLHGAFLGPSFLVGSTTDASVGDPSHAQAYWGAAFDVGGQAVLLRGFTIGGGLGLGVVKMGDAVAVYPRLLAQAGWSF